MNKAMSQAQMPYTSCLGYLIFSFTVLNKGNYQVARREVLLVMRKFLHLSIFRMMYCFPIETLEEIETIKNEFIQGVSSPSISMMFIYVSRQEFLDYYHNFEIEVSNAKKVKKK